MPARLAPGEVRAPQGSPPSRSRARRARAPAPPSRVHRRRRGLEVPEAPVHLRGAPASCATRSARYGATFTPPRSRSSRAGAPPRRSAAPCRLAALHHRVVVHAEALRRSALAWSVAIAAAFAASTGRRARTAPRCSAQARPGRRAVAARAAGAVRRARSPRGRVPGPPHGRTSRAIPLRAAVQVRRLVAPALDPPHRRVVAEARGHARARGGGIRSASDSAARAPCSLSSRRASTPW